MYSVIIYKNNFASLLIIHSPSTTFANVQHFRIDIISSPRFFTYPLEMHPDAGETYLIIASIDLVSLGNTGRYFLFLFAFTRILHGAHTKTGKVGGGEGRGLQGRTKRDVYLKAGKHYNPATSRSSESTDAES